jgi:hypothetical protein
VQEPTYNQDGSYAVTEIRSQDNKDRWLVKLNLERGSFEELDYNNSLLEASVSRTTTSFRQ